MLRITTGGNVIIGTQTGSGNKLTLYGTNAAVVMQNSTTGTGGNNGAYIGNGNGNILYLWNYEQGDIRFATANLDRIRIKANGTSASFNVNPLNISGAHDNITYPMQVTVGTNQHVSFAAGAHDDYSNEGPAIIFSRVSDGSKALMGLFGYDNTSLGISARGDIRFLTGGTSTYSATESKMRITSGSAVEIGSGTGSSGGGLAIYGGTVNQVSGQDAALYVRHDSSADWGIWLYKQHEYGMRIDTASSVTLAFAIYNGTTNKFKVEGDGDVVAAGSIDSASDIKLKTNIKTIDNALDKVLQLRGAEYDRIDKDNQHEIGVIAQEVEEVIPELVHGDETKTVSYGNMTAVLIEAIKEQNEIINRMRKEIEDLKN